MGITICKDCGKIISTDAKSCVNCGASVKKNPAMEEYRYIIKNLKNFDYNQKARLKERLLELKKDPEFKIEREQAMVKQDKKDGIWVSSAVTVILLTIIFYCISECNNSRKIIDESTEKLVKNEVLAKEDVETIQYQIKSSIYENNNTRIRYKVVVKDDATKDELLECMKSINQKNTEKIKPFVAEFYTQDMNISGICFASGEFINNEYDVNVLIDMTSNMTNIDKNIIGKWHMYGSDILVIYEEAGRCFSDFYENGALTGNDCELEKISINGNTAYTHKIKDEWSETYEITPDGVIIIDATGNRGYLMPNAN